MAPPRWCACCCVAHPAGQVCPLVAARQAALDRARPSAATRGYDSHWRVIRAQFLRAHPRCVECGAPATDVDHIDGHSAHNVWRNLRPYCHRCHSARTARDQGFGRGK